MLHTIYYLPFDAGPSQHVGEPWMRGGPADAHREDSALCVEVLSLSGAPGHVHTCVYPYAHAHRLHMEVLRPVRLGMRMPMGMCACMSMHVYALYRGPPSGAPGHANAHVHVRSHEHACVCSVSRSSARCAWICACTHMHDWYWYWTGTGTGSGTGSQCLVISIQ